MDTHKVEQLYNKYARGMLRAANAKTDDYHLAQDAVQQTFIKILKMDSSKIDDSDERRVFNLLCMMAQQAVTELFNKKAKAVGEQILDKEDFQMESECEGDPLDCLLQKIAVEEVRDAMMSLPDSYLQPMLLKYVHGLTNEDIARTMGIEANNVYIRIHRGREKLKKILGKGSDL